MKIEHQKLGVSSVPLQSHFNDQVSIFECYVNYLCVNYVKNGKGGDREMAS
jgi:hypothetical protein